MRGGSNLIPVRLEWDFGVLCPSGGIGVGWVYEGVWFCGVGVCAIASIDMEGRVATGVRVCRGGVWIVGVMDIIEGVVVEGGAGDGEVA